MLYVAPIHCDLSQDTWPPKHLSGTRDEDRRGPSRPGLTVQTSTACSVFKVWCELMGTSCSGSRAGSHLRTNARDSLGTSLLTKNFRPSKILFWASCSFCSFSLASMFSMSSYGGKKGLNSTRACREDNNCLVSSFSFTKPSRLATRECSPVQHLNSSEYSASLVLGPYSPRTASLPPVISLAMQDWFKGSWMAGMVWMPWMVGMAGKCAHPVCRELVHLPLLLLGSGHHPRQAGAQGRQFLDKNETPRSMKRDSCKHRDNHSTA